FKDALLSNQYLSKVQADQADGQNLGVNSTPTFYLNGKKLGSTPSVDSFKQLIDAELK
ncbi:DsbA family protein, partial [Candidatus Parcubacteria bacterium]|nr:DsbA family protein [Candidatus Parcubacteria bacterium]